MPDTPYAAGADSAPPLFDFSLFSAENTLEPPAADAAPPRQMLSSAAATMPPQLTLASAAAEPPRALPMQAERRGF